METVMSGVTADEQAVLQAIGKKLHPQPEKPAPAPGIRPAPAAVRATTELAQDTDLNPQPADPAQGDQQPQDAVDGQPAEGQIPEGEEAAIAVELPPTMRIPTKDENGKDVEVDLPVDEVRSGYMRHADYTRKTQALAKERAAIPQQLAESKRVVTETQTQFTQALQNLQQFVVHAAAPELQNVNWNALSQENPTEYVRLKQRAEQVNATLGQIQNHQRRIAAQAEQQQKQAAHEAAIAARETLNREIPGGWNDDLYVKITKGAVNHYGYTPEEFGTFTDARTILMANDALKYRDLMSGKTIAQQKVEKAPLAVRPGAAATGAEKRQTQVDKAREAVRKSGSVDDALSLLQAKRARQAR